MASDAQARMLLVDLLKEAASLEHSLLDAYIFAACSLKTTPQEFETIGNRPNRRRAQQFERVRAWKQTLLAVATEEMRHLHFVQCMLRALGRPPHFSLPPRNTAGVWEIGNWRAKVGSAEGRPVTIPIERLSDATANRFVLFEASDSLQDADPFGTVARDLYGRLADFELDLRIESMVLSTGAADRDRLRRELRRVYREVSAVPDEHLVALAAAAPALPALEQLRFQSIADLYYGGILPLYEQAFELGWVTDHNRDLNDELLDARYAVEGFLPVGPVTRSLNFTQFAKQNTEDPLRHYKNVRDVVREIVEEGEGFAAFERRATEFLATISRVGVEGYLKALLVANTRDAHPPDWVVRGELLRQSHLYRFAIVTTEMERERSLGDPGFEPARTPLDVTGHAALSDLANELPGQFNACYLVLVSWLSRIYELRHWTADTRRRNAIEMLATWPLMSLAIRPMLELAAMLPIDTRRLFRLDGDSLPLLPVLAQQLLGEYTEPKRSESGNARMDYLATRVLSSVAAWAARQEDGVSGSGLPPGAVRLVVSRLRALSHLGEFQEQFPFRVSGGYSSRLPDQLYRRLPTLEEKRFEEDASTLQPLFKDTLLLRLRFAGRGLVQLATDPDPPTDEAGCSGTHMLHAADGDRVLDRSLIWQPATTPRAIVRGPDGGIPPVGVRCASASLLVAGSSGVTAGYVPLQVVQSTGAVQASGVMQTMSVSGFNELVTLDPGTTPSLAAIRVTLQPKGDQWPYLVGENHLTWQDGEPIDPFILAVLAEPETTGAAPTVLCGREVYNEGRTFLQLDPVQRALSARPPVGFDFNLADIPDWALARLSPIEQQMLADPKYPRSYLVQRGGVLSKALLDTIGAADDSREQFDAIVSYAERLKLVNVPRGTTVIWLTILLRYGHTISGEQLPSAEVNPILAAIQSATGVSLRLTSGDPRTAANGRWLLAYTKGMMDTDALSDLVFGELYIPVVLAGTADPVRFERRWSFPASMRDVVIGYACQFTKPFWAQFAIGPDGRTRTVTTPLGEITEQLTASQPTGYTYSATGLAKVTNYVGGFTLDGEQGAARVTLRWNVSYVAGDATTSVNVLALLGSTADTMTQRLNDEFRAM